MLDAILPLGASATILIVIGLLLIASELSAPAHGLAAGLGIATIAGGAAVLLCPAAAAMIHAPVLLLGGLLSLAAAGLVTTMSLSVRRRGIRTGREALLGMTGPVLSWEGSGGHVLVHGERWRASGAALAPGGLARVVGIDGLTLEVEHARDGDGAE
jgi:membrane-bound serine protease (ClpP class)